MTPEPNRKAAFRLDAGPAIGGGHLMRCLVLARSLAARGWECRFFSAEMSTVMVGHVARAGFETHLLCEACTPLDETDDAARFVDAVRDWSPTWVIVDHYALGVNWEGDVRASVSRCLVIDDLGREHDCDIVFDQNYYDEPTARYSSALACGAMGVFGPAYALLRPQFSAVKAHVREDGVRRLLVSFGATDPTGETSKALECVLGLVPGTFHTDVLVDPARLPDELLERVASRSDVVVSGWTDDIAKLMAQADLAIGAGGGTAWERCKMGLPALVITVADNQRPSMQGLAAQGAIELLGDSSSVTEARICSALKRLKDAPADLSRMSRRALEVAPSAVDGALYLAELMEVLTLAGRMRYSLRRMRETDLPMVLEWRNAPEVRAASRNSAEIPWRDHVAWFERCRRDESRAQLVFAVDGCPSGVVSFAPAGEWSDIFEWSFYLAPDDPPKGTGMRMLSLALDWAFLGELAATEIRGDVVASNARSMAVHQRLGFSPVDEGLASAPGVCGFSITRDAWQRVRERIFERYFEEKQGGHHAGQ